MKFVTNSRDPIGMNYNNFGDHLNFNVALSCLICATLWFGTTFHVLSLVDSAKSLKPITQYFNIRHHNNKLADKMTLVYTNYKWQSELFLYISKCGLGMFFWRRDLQLSSPCDLDNVFSIGRHSATKASTASPTHCHGATLSLWSTLMTPTQICFRSVSAHCTCALPNQHLAMWPTVETGHRQSNENMAFIFFFTDTNRREL